MKAALAIALLSLMAFCVFGFLETFEPLDEGTQFLWRSVYAVGFVATVGGLIWLWRAKRASGS